MYNIKKRKKINVLIFVCVIYLQSLEQWKMEVNECKMKIKNTKNKNQNMRGGREKTKKKINCKKMQSHKYTKKKFKTYEIYFYKLLKHK
jgi:hypothetical protein